MHKTRFNPPFCHKMPCNKSGKWPLLHYSSFLCVLRFGVVSLLCRSSLTFDTFPSVLVCNPYFFVFVFLSIYEFWTAVFLFTKTILVDCEGLRRIETSKQRGPHLTSVSTISEDVIPVSESIDDVVLYGKHYALVFN